MVVTQKDILLKIEQLERKGISHDQNIRQIFQVLKQLIGKQSNLGNQHAGVQIGFKTKKSS